MVKRPQQVEQRTPFERFAALTKRVVAVPKPEIDKRETDITSNGRVGIIVHIVKVGSPA